MVKRRTLRPRIQAAIELMSFLIIGFFCSLNDFKVTLRSVLIILSLCAILALNAAVLKKYGRYNDV